MSDTAIIFGILGALFVGVISPGPSFVLVSRIAVAESRPNGVAAAIGMGLGGAIFGGLALAGLTALIQQVGWLYLVLKIVGGLYLLYIAIMIWRHAASPLATTSGAANRDTLARSFYLAFVTQITNPKTAVFYASIFAALLPAAPSWTVLLTLPPALFVMEGGWYALVALLFSSSRPRAVYLRAKAWIDRIASAVIGLLGLRLIWEAVRP